MQPIKTTWTTQYLADDVGVQAIIPASAENITDVLYLVGHMSNEWFEETNIARMVEGSTIALIAIDDLGSWGGINRPDDNFFYEDFIRRDVLPDTEASFGIGINDVRRHIGGFSKGSYLAMRMGVLFSNLFGHIISCSGGNADAYGLYYDMEKVIPGLVAKMFPGITSARQFDLSDYNMENLLRRLAAKGTTFPFIDMYCGNEDLVARSANIRLDGVLTELGIVHTFTMLDGPHGWHNAEKAMNAAIGAIKETAKN